LIAAECGGEGQFERDALLAVKVPDGADYSLELGGALEYSSPPFHSLADLIEAARRDMTMVAELARSLRIAVVPAGMVPFTNVAHIPWIPKARIPVMREYFRRLGPAGSSAEAVMGLTLSAQTTLDYVSEDDLVERLRLLVRSAPIAAALFVNSPLDNGRPCGALSRRMQLWQHVDPRRCGVLAFAAEPGFTVDSIAAWALGLPMIYRANGDGHVRASGRTFADVMSDGFENGAWPGLDDWRSHLSQLWPQVRPRDTLEVRAADGPAWTAFASAPSFWTGLVYDDDARRSALALLDGLTVGELTAAGVAVAADGMRARAGGESVGELAGELLRLADQGLGKRVAAGLEPACVLAYLDPLREVANSGVTFAERLLLEWNGRPDAFVRTYRI
jgi:glutamate--cysteine ligase